MIKALFLAANPAGTTPLALEEEVRAIDAKIRSSEHRGRLHLVSHWAVRLDDLSGLLMREKPDIVHFSGHGVTTGDIYLVDANGSPKAVPPEALEGLFRVLKDNVRVVVFNACHSEAQAKMVAKVIDCTVGMGRAIDDGHAIAFAAEFYQALGYGKSVRDAYELGKIRLVGEGVADASKLVTLHKRRGIDPAKVVLVGSGPAVTGPAPPASTPPPTPTPRPSSPAAPSVGDHQPPRVFISYSWDGDAHTDWVKQLATRLRTEGGVDVTLDRWHAVPGDQLPEFMERAVRENDFVIAVCTPKYKEKSDRRGGGVGYEGDIMTAEVFTGGNQRKFIPVLRCGPWSEAAPSWLLGKFYIDLRGDPYTESNYERLVRTLHGVLEPAPPVGPRPTFGPRPRGSETASDPVRPGGPHDRDLPQPGDIAPASSLRPLKTVALLDRRLATEMLVLLSRQDQPALLDSRLPRLLLFGTALYEQLLVENQYGSTLLQLISREPEILRDVLCVLRRPNLPGDDPEFGEMVADAADVWAGDPQFQLVVAQYDRKKGGGLAAVEENVAYLQHALSMARHFNAALLPHPDRWPLFRWLFENSVWAMSRPAVASRPVPLPADPMDASFQMPLERSRRVGQLANRLPGPADQPLGLVRYGPMSYPFPRGLLRRYEQDDLTAGPQFLYEFCVPYTGSMPTEDSTP